MKALTENEKGLLALASFGYTIQHIADMRKRSYQTIKNELTVIRRKVDAHNTTQAVAIAIRSQLIR